MPTTKILVSSAVSIFVASLMRSIVCCANSRLDGGLSGEDLLSKGVAAEVEREAISAVTQIAIAAPLAAGIRREVRGETANNSTASKSVTRLILAQLIKVSGASICP